MKKLYYLFVVLVLLYLIESFVLPQDSETLERYNLSPFQGRLLTVSVIIPLTLIWLIAFIGFIRFKRYSLSIIKNADGFGMNRISDGLGILAYGLIITSILSGFFNYLSRVDPEVTQKSLIVSDLMSVILSLSGFLLISTGAFLLLDFIKVKVSTAKRSLPLVIIIILAIIIGFYLWTNSQAAINFSRSDDADLDATAWTVTIIKMFLFLLTWYFGISAYINIGIYAGNVKGILYKKALGFLSVGILYVIISSILTIALYGFNFENLTISGIIILVYILLFVISLGYVLIAVGANKLKKIEVI